MEIRHSETFKVKGTQCDLYRRMRPDALFVEMQEGGERHAAMLGCSHPEMLKKGLFFVLARVHFTMTRAPRCGETVRHTTWPGQMNRFFCPRYHVFELEDGTPLVSVATLWVLLDVNERKIVNPAKAEIDFPDTSAFPAPVSLPMRIPAIVGDAVQSTRTPVYSEYDINGHVNNTKYVAWLCDALGVVAFQDAFIYDLVAGFEKEIREEAPLSLSLSRKDDTFSFVVSSSAGGKHFVAGGALRREDENT